MRHVRRERADSNTWPRWWCVQWCRLAGGSTLLGPTRLLALHVCSMLAVEHEGSQLPAAAVVLLLAVMVDSYSSGTLSQNPLFLP